MCPESSPTPPFSGVKFRGLSEKLSPVQSTSSSTGNPPPYMNSFPSCWSPRCYKLPLIVSTDGCIPLGLRFLYACVF